MVPLALRLLCACRGTETLRLAILGDSPSSVTGIREATQPRLRSGGHAAKKARKTALGQSCSRRRHAFPTS
jgi:hypothetical protein